jgi:hypothetical protein
MQLVADQRFNPSFFGYYLVLVVLAVGPLLWLWRHLLTARAWVAIGLCVVSFLPLYGVAMDWGRWLNVAVVSGVFLLLARLARDPAAWPTERFGPRARALLVLYVLGWAPALSGQLQVLKPVTLPSELWSNVREVAGARTD